MHHQSKYKLVLTQKILFSTHETFHLWIVRLFLGLAGIKGILYKLGKNLIVFIPLQSLSILEQDLNVEHRPILYSIPSDLRRYLCRVR
jgi:hypothetical protein